MSSSDEIFEFPCKNALDSMRFFTSDIFSTVDMLKLVAMLFMKISRGVSQMDVIVIMIAVKTKGLDQFFLHEADFRRKCI